MQRWRERPGIRIIVVSVLVMASYLPSLAPTASAVSNFSETIVRLDRMSSGVTTGGLVCAKPSSTTPSEAGLKIVFPTTVTLTGVPTLTGTTATITDPGGGTVTAWPGLASATVTQSGQTVTVSFTSTNGDLTSTSALYCFTFSAVATLGTAGSATSAYAGFVRTYNDNTTMDNTTLVMETPYAIAIVGSTHDQVVVTAVVPPIFSFALSGFTDPFTTDLDPASVVSTSGVTATVTTNAKGGWIAWAKDQFAGLHSTAAAYTIPSTGTASGSTFALTGGTNTEGYLMDVNATPGSGPCTVAATAEYNGGATEGGILATSFKQVATCTGSAPATSAGDAITIVEKATIKASTPAATDYTDTITLVGAGNF
jgi:hypothetical protein